MKKLSIIVLALLIITGCSNSNMKDNGSNNITSNQESLNKEWGIPETVSNSNENGIAYFDISFPHLVGIPEASGLFGYQDDGTVVIVDTELMGLSPAVDNVEDIFPAYFEQTEVILRAYYMKDFVANELTIDKQELVDINGYKMSKYEGAWNFKLAGKSTTYQYTAYGVLLNANQGVVYWMVLDTTEAQSLKDTIDSHAYNMALSLEEFEI